MEGNKDEEDSHLLLNSFYNIINGDG